jgi:hypothetical protein
VAGDGTSSLRGFSVTAPRLSREDWEALESGDGGATSARDAARRMAWAAF